MTGYHSIRQTQTNLFNKNFVGIGPESHDLSFPDMSKIAVAYGFPYYSARKNEEIPEVIEKVLKQEGPVICEVFVSPKQTFEPKSATKKLEDRKISFSSTWRFDAIFAKRRTKRKYDNRYVRGIEWIN